MPKARILAVDDQRYFRELIDGLLSHEGYEVHTAESGEQALRALECDDYDVIVTDLVMPGIDGTELVQQIKERRPDQDIIMVTGVVDVKSAVEAMKVGATDYILKPFDRKVLTRSLDKIEGKIEKALEKGDLKKRGNAVLLIGISSYNDSQAAKARRYFRKAREFEDTEVEADRWLKHIANDSRAG